MFNDIRQLVAGLIGHAQVLERRPRGIERFGRQAELHEAGRGHAELLLMLPIGRQRGRASGERRYDKAEKDVTKPEQFS
jgi:hypothetical protein